MRRYRCRLADDRCRPSAATLACQQETGQATAMLTIVPRQLVDIGVHMRDTAAINKNA